MPPTLLVLLEVLAQAQEDWGPGRQPASGSPALVQAGRPGPRPIPSTANSHLVAGQRALGGLEVRAGLAHKDVPLAGDRPDGLRRGAAVDPPALAAGQVEEGELPRGGGSAPGSGVGGPRAPDPCPLTQSLMSCSVAAARRTGHLCRVLSGVYRAKECLASLSTGTSAVTSLRNTWMYCWGDRAVTGGLGAWGALGRAPAR